MIESKFTPFDDWVHLKLVDNRSKIEILDGHEKNVNDEDTLFEVLMCGPAVKKVKIGDTVVCSFAMGMFRFKLPGESKATFALRESELIGKVTQVNVVPKQGSEIIVN